jgi:hypothetical protein
MLTLPTFHRIRRFLAYDVLPQNAVSRLPAQSIILRRAALSGSTRVTVMPELAISPEKLAYIIEKAREYDVKEAETDPDSGSNPTDDDAIDVLEDDGSDPTGQELEGFIRALNEDEQIDLIALTWLGRGDGDIGDWDELRRRAEERRNEYRSPRRETVHYLLGEPMLADFVADGLDAFGVEWGDERTTPDSSSPSERDEDEGTRKP